MHVFVTALLQIGGSQPWAGAISFTDPALEQQWFAGYWQAVKPYLQAAANAGAEQFAVATEEEWLEINAPDNLWNDLINKAHSVFPGSLTYDMNWTGLHRTPRAWMSNPNLPMVGISAYLPQIPTSKRLERQDIVNIWKTSTLPQLDAFATALGKPIFLSEIGYRNSADALYQPWKATSDAPDDPEEQAFAVGAALESIATDKNILGSFFWGWDVVDSFALKAQPAADIIHTYYQSWQA
jgi:hypothetical protein